MHVNEDQIRKALEPNYFKNHIENTLKPPLFPKETFH